MTIRPGTQRALGRRRGLGQLGGDQSPDPAAERARELRLAVLRGQRPPGRLRRRSDLSPLQVPLRVRTSTGSRSTPTTTTPRSSPRSPARPGSSSIAGLAFNPAGSPWPAEFDGALFFTDYSRGCIWVMEQERRNAARARRGSAPSGPAPTGPVNLQFGPGGDLFYPDFNARNRSSASTTARATRPAGGGQRNTDQRLDPAAGGLQRRPPRATRIRATRSPTTGTSTVTAPTTTPRARRRRTRTPPPAATWPA